MRRRTVVAEVEVKIICAIALCIGTNIEDFFLIKQVLEREKIK